MKITALLQRGAKTLEQEVEIVPHESPNGIRKFQIGGKSIEALVEEITPGVYSIILNGRTYEAFVSKLAVDSPGSQALTPWPWGSGGILSSSETHGDGGARDPPSRARALRKSLRRCRVKS